MKLPHEATRATALASGVVLGTVMPSIDFVGKLLGLTPEVKNLVFMISLVALFFGSVLLFVVGTPYLAFGFKDLMRTPYWQSLGQVAVRSLFWLAGCGLGFAVLAALRS